MIDSVVALAREMNIFGRTQMHKGGRMGPGTSRSKEEPSLVAGTKTYLTAVAERWERSEAAAAMIERYIEWMAEFKEVTCTTI
jgi:hypothetical protein